MVSWMLRRRGSKRDAAESKTAESKPAIMTEIVPPEDEPSCRAVWAYEGNLYAAGEAPTLPVEGCDKTECRCRYAAVVPQA